MKTKIKISKIKYFETRRRGVGYIVTTNVGNIYNDGNGSTYVDKNWKGENLTELELEDLIEEYEGINMISYPDKFPYEFKIPKK